MTRTNLKYLELLSEQYPTIQSACTEIINLQAILNLPKGTEHFVSDIHGEAEAFTHILNNASGVIREKVDILFEKSLSSAVRTELCTLIYYPERKLEEIKQNEEDMYEWYRITLYRLIDVCRLCASKYTRSKVRKACPQDFSYIIDELLHTDSSDKNKQNYYENIIKTILDVERADAFIIALTGVIKRLVVDRLHVVGDVFDRGPHADVILDKLMNHHAVDIQWGNHDILWMGAAAGSAACIACVLNISTKYSNIDFVENAYGINLRPLALFAQQTYTDDTDLLDHMHKAIAIIQFKLEGQVILRHPEFGMEDRLLLDKIDFDDMTVLVDGQRYALNDNDFPTIDPKHPYELTGEEAEVVTQLISSFAQSEKLQRHVKFLYSQGSLYKVFNGNLLFHGCIPMTEEGGFYALTFGETPRGGKALMDYADSLARQGYYGQAGSDIRKYGQDFLWYLWCGKRSPLFGRSKIATFERMFIDDKESWKEEKDPYYKHVESQEMCEKILREFGLTDQYSHIVNGHVPVRFKDGEFPVRGGGKMIVIDGGFCRAYQTQTGIAGYTMFYSSYGIRLVSHEPFSGLADAIQYNKDILSTYVVFDTAQTRITVGETDVGLKLQADIDDLNMLLAAYRNGTIKEKHL
ncbi:fructose-1,6-bisphosphatase [Christensenella timonensis]|uniref:fructose-1,6-bisphosphatase n=1 Tax=Christensenella timonensis TaxID=1816678 RepID=UPI000837088A|nr:fructose-1,6-bisphosphatase [Christensenella timonensis]